MKSKILLIFFLFILLANVSNASLISDVQNLSEEITNFVIPDNPVVIVGDHASAAEKAQLTFLKSQYAEFKSVPSFKESEYQTANFSKKMIILIGGPTQNELSKQFLDNASYTKKINSFTYGRIVFLNGTNKVIIFSDNAGYGNLPRLTENSPLSGIIPKEYIPATATIIGFSLIWLWSFILVLFKKIVTFNLADKIMGKVKKKAFKKEYFGFKIKKLKIKLREWIAVFISALVFAASLGYLYLSPSSNSTQVFMMMVIVNFLVYGIRNLSRLMLDIKYDMHTEYHVWYAGAFITAITAYLGNVFGLAGYIITEKEKNVNNGKISFIVNMISFVSFVIFFILNFLFPSIFFQMSMLLCLAITFLQMLPLNPFSGKGIYRWKRWVWWVSFIPLTIIYILINLFV